MLMAKRRDELMERGKMCSWKEARCAHSKRRDVLMAGDEMCLVLYRREMCLYPKQMAQSSFAKV